MTMFFAKKLNKKGFTLAELLVVIAIIAVLVAIAIPIFMSSLDSARIAVHQANARAIKAAGVVVVMNNKTLYDGADTSTYWTATATVTKGEITSLKVTKAGSAAGATVEASGSSSSGSGTAVDSAKDIDPEGAKYTVIFGVTDLSNT